MTQDSEIEHVDKAVSHYSSLFTLPSYRSITIFLFILCAVTGAASVFPFSNLGLSFGPLVGALLFLATFFGNYVTVHAFLRKEVVLNLRRFSFLSLSSNLILLAFLSVANLTLTFFRDVDLWVKVVSFGFFAAISLRFLVIYSISSGSFLKVFLSVLLQPTLFLILVLFIPFSSFGFKDHYFLHFSVATVSAFFGVYLFVASLNVVGIKALGVPSIKLFRAFLADWAENLEKPFEEVLEQLSEEREVTVSLIAFKTKERFKGIIAVPFFHPGPFRNIGSSSIPSLIQESLEKKMGCIVSVPHGISGHELDLASNIQNEKVLNRVLKAAEFNVFHTHITPFLTLKKEDVIVGCQAFGDCVLITLTLAPKTMEDLPLELNDSIAQEAKKWGFTWAIAIDAHNSIEGPFNVDNFIAPIKEAVANILEKAASCEKLFFKVGAGKVTPKEFSIKEGMGPGGISVIIINVGEEKTAYVTIDGNNMVSGLREKILSSLQELGVSNGEILTTDTHVVNGVVKVARGYHPVGEVIDHGKLIEHVKKAASEALSKMEPAEVSWRQETIAGVKVIGEEQIDSLCAIVDKGAVKAKRNSLIIFPAVGILLTLLYIFL